MGARRYLDEAVGLLVTARRRAELHRYSRELLYNFEVLIRACSRVNDQLREENRQREIKKGEEKLREYQEKIKALEKQAKAKTNFRTKRKKKKVTRKSDTQKRIKKLAA